MKKNPKVSGAVMGLSALAAAYVYNARRLSSQVPPHIRPEGAPKTIETKILEVGSKVLQSQAAMKNYNIYLVGFHPMVDDPCHQIEAHHYCKQVNEDFAQCLLFDSNTEDANLTGLEYIISEKLFHQLPDEEKGFWHPHNYEILSGMLTAPGLFEMAENRLMKTKINSYGKTFHTWRAKCWEGNKPYLDTLPKGDVLHSWSFNFDGEIKPEILQNRDENMHVNTNAKRQNRVHLKAHTHAQEGVNKCCQSTMMID
jgi:hypothetical protein